MPEVSEVCRLGLSGFHPCLFPGVFGNGVVAMRPPGVAFKDAFQAQPDAFKYAPFFDGADHIM